MSQQRSFHIFSLYNQRMNQQLLSCSKTLSNAQLLEQTRSFFPTIIDYWNHLLFGDLIMLGRIVSNRIGKLDPNVLHGLPTAKTTSDVYSEPIDGIEVIRTRLDKVIIDIVDVLSEHDLAQTITYNTTEGDTVTAKVGDVLQHMFNHQTHHRGQLTCLLSQQGLDFGCTDLPVLVPEMKIL